MAAGPGAAVKGRAGRRRRPPFGSLASRGRRACSRRSRGTRRAAGSGPANQELEARRRARTADVQGCGPTTALTATRSAPGRRWPPSPPPPADRCPAPPCGDTPPLSARVVASESTTSGQPALGAANRLAAMANETWSATRQEPAGTQRGHARPGWPGRGRAAARAPRPPRRQDHHRHRGGDAPAGPPWRGAVAALDQAGEAADGGAGGDGQPRRREVGVVVEERRVAHDRRGRQHRGGQGEPLQQRPLAEPRAGSRRR